MNPKATKASPEKRDSGSVPFDEALRRLVNAPPQHKPSKKPAKKPEAKVGKGNRSK